MANKKPSNEQTSARVASKASKLLSNPKVSAWGTQVELTGLPK